MSRRSCRVAGAVCAVAAFGSTAQAQNYSFEVPRLRLEVFVETDASVRLSYEIEFLNRPGAHEIDVVDVGLPVAGYDRDSLEASLDGDKVGPIRSSEYVHPGLEVHLGSRAIAPGRPGTFRFAVRIPDLVFQDTTRDDYASLRITPTWFGREFVVGAGKTELAIHLPAGVAPDVVLHQGTPFADKALYQGRAVVVWRWQEPAVQQHLVGVSFPKAPMARVVHISRWELASRWLSGHPRIVFGIVAGSALLFGLLFFRFSGGTGCCLFVPMAGILVLFLVGEPLLGVIVIPVLGSLVYLNERLLGRRKRHYLPAVLSVEGGGIKRGLTAPEAAALLELPIAKVLGLVVFGLLRKGVIRQVPGEKLIVELAPEFVPRKGQAASALRLAAAQEKGIVLHKYEGPFLDQIHALPGRPLEQVDFSVAAKGLVEKVAQRLRGFDVGQTREYYRYVVRRALKEAEGVGDIAQRKQLVDERLEWLMLDEQAPTTLGRIVPGYWPRWHVPASGIPASVSGGGGAAATPSLSDVAASFSGWAENTMGGMASALSPTALQLPGAKGGFIDLGGLDKVTSSVFEALASGGGGSGGGGGGCACACAGCACACACAGGGR